MAKDTINVGLVGYRFMGKAHSNAYRQVYHFFPNIPVRPVLKALCGRDAAAVQAAADVLGWESCETDWRQLIARDDIDLIDVSAPGNLHAKIAVAAAAAGKHVFCEKPLGNTAQEARAMLDAANNAGVKHAVFFNYRKLPAIAVAKQLITEGKLGKIYHWRSVYLQDWLVNPNHPIVWRLKKEFAGSGVNGDLNAHLIDLARFLVGEIAEVCGLTETFIKQRPVADGPDHKVTSGTADVTVEDACLALARFDNGAVGSFEASRFALGRKNYNRFEVNGSQGSLVFNLERPNELEIYTEDSCSGTHGFRTINATTGFDPYSGHYWPPAHNLGYEHTFINFLYDALTAIGNGQNPSPDFNDGYINNVVIDAIEKSASTKNWELVRP
jgi:predicted dehydrogenase